MKVLNHQNYKITINPLSDSGEMQFSLQDPWGITQTTDNVVLTAVPQTFTNTVVSLPAHQRQAAVNAYLLERVSRAGPFDIHIEEYNSRPLIVMGEYGLKGGGSDERGMAKVFSALQVGFGILLMGSGVGLISGATLLCSGMRGGIYAFKKDDMEFDSVEYGKQSAVGAAAGLAGGAAGAVVNVIAAPTTVVAELLTVVGTGAATGAANNSAGDIADAVLHDKELPSTKKLLVSGLVGGIGGGLAGGAGVLANIVVGSSVANAEIARRGLLDLDELATGLAQTVGGAAGGAAGGAVNQVATNVLKDKEWNEGLTEATLMGGALGGAIGASQARANQGLHQARQPYITRLTKITREFQQIAKSTPNAKFRVNGHTVSPEVAATAYSQGKSVKVVIKKTGKNGKSEITKTLHDPSVADDYKNYKIADKQLLENVKHQITELPVAVLGATNQAANALAQPVDVADANVQRQAVDEPGQLVGAANVNVQRQVVDEPAQPIDAADVNVQRQAVDAPAQPGHPVYPRFFTDYKLPQRKLTAKTVAHTFWMVHNSNNRGGGPQAALMFRQQFILWAQTKNLGFGIAEVNNALSIYTMSP